VHLAPNQQPVGHQVGTLDRIAHDLPVVARGDEPEAKPSRLRQHDGRMPHVDIVTAHVEPPNAPDLEPRRLQAPRPNEPEARIPPVIAHPHDDLHETSTDRIGGAHEVERACWTAHDAYRVGVADVEPGRRQRLGGARP
jgi:hypothetical protein